MGGAVGARGEEGRRGGSWVGGAVGARGEEGRRGGSWVGGAVGARGEVVVGVIGECIEWWVCCSLCSKLDILE